MAIINEGKIIIKAKTQESMDSLKGKIWEKEIQKHEKRLYDEQYDVLSDRLFAGKTYIRVYYDINPNNGFVPADVTLEDVYFFHLTDIN